VTTAAALPRSHRSWRIWRIGPLNERAFRIRLVIVPVMIAIQLFLYYRLWTAVYEHTTSAGGLDVRQAVTYSLMALLAARIRWSARSWSMDNVSTRVREGTIIYWFIRPITPARYYMWRQTGDMAYGAMWAITGYVVLLSTGVIVGPGNASRTAVFVVSLVLGQVVLYYLGQLVDLSTFWILSNNGVARMYYFIQDRCRACSYRSGSCRVGSSRRRSGCRSMPASMCHSRYTSGAPHRHEPENSSHCRHCGYCCSPPYRTGFGRARLAE
jgi:ABC-type uncharacterized transport system permease subunit